MKPTIWIFSLEPIESRYTAQWHEHVPALFKRELGDDYVVVQVDGVQKSSTPTPGAFLNFSDTNYWKSSQLCKFLDYLNAGEVGPNDHILFTDAWNPTAIQLRYMSDLLGYKWTLHGMWHAGSYDPQDFLGRIIGDADWVRHAEDSFYFAFDHNYFATEFHIKLFTGVRGRSFYPQVWAKSEMNGGKVVRTGWPMEYMDELLSGGDHKKDNLILFPHRIAPEKQVEIFRDLAKHLPHYEFVVCQDQQLTKHQYHTLLKRAKMVFSANLQETLGISPYEGALVGAVPLVPDRLSYTEMYDDVFKYPSEWTENFTEYEKCRPFIIDRINNAMTNYDQLQPMVSSQAEALSKHFFSAANLIDQFKNA